MTGDHIYIIPTQFHRPPLGMVCGIGFPWLGWPQTADPRQLHPRPGWNVHPHHSASPSRSWYCRLRGWDSISVLPIQFTDFNGEFQAKFPTKISMNFIKWRIPQTNPMSWKYSSNTRLVNTAFSTSVSAVMRLASCSCCLRAVVEIATESMLRREVPTTSSDPISYCESGHGDWSEVQGVGWCWYITSTGYTITYPNHLYLRSIWPKCACLYSTQIEMPTHNESQDRRGWTWNWNTLHIEHVQQHAFPYVSPGVTSFGKYECFPLENPISNLEAPNFDLPCLLHLLRHLQLLPWCAWTWTDIWGCTSTGEVDMLSQL